MTFRFLQDERAQSPSVSCHSSLSWVSGRSLDGGRARRSRSRGIRPPHRHQLRCSAALRQGLRRGRQNHCRDQTWPGRPSSASCRRISGSIRRWPTSRRVGFNVGGFQAASSPSTGASDAQHRLQPSEAELTTIATSIEAAGPGRAPLRTGESTWSPRRHGYRGIPRNAVFSASDSCC